MAFRIPFLGSACQLSRSRFAQLAVTHLSLLALTWSTLTGTARAEPMLLNAEGSAALAITSPQSDVFGAGGAVSVGLLEPLWPALLVGGRLRLGLLTEGDPPENQDWFDPGTGGLGTLFGVVRVRPLADVDDVRRGTGLYVELAGGGAITGDLTRFAFDAGLGWGFDVGGLDLGPTARYVQVLQPQGDVDHDHAGSDARVVMLGLEVAFFDARPTIKLRTPEPPKPEPPKKDRDGDGIVDLEDLCPEQPEDADEFEDEDGCPDPDNDSDGIEDKDDACPDSPEDTDEFEDEDGCPDPDNDRDNFLDSVDACPNEPETINGNKDFDGCPDEGLVQMINDRIVLDEHVLFDSERARVKRSARPILRAIANLQAQHPEWIALRVEGHSDAQGDMKFNEELSKRRAENVRKELIRMGVPEGVIEAEGYGASRIRDLRDEPDAHQRNRRVEFVVVARRALTPEPQPGQEEQQQPESPPSDSEGKGEETEAQGDAAAKPADSQPAEGDKGEGGTAADPAAEPPEQSKASDGEAEASSGAQASGAQEEPQ